MPNPITSQMQTQSSHRNNRQIRNARTSTESTPPPPLQLHQQLSQGSGIFMGNDIMVQTIKNLEDVSLVEKSARRHHLMRARLNKDNWLRLSIPSAAPTEKRPRINYLCAIYPLEASMVITPHFIILDQHGRCHFPAPLAPQRLRATVEHDSATEPQAELADDRWKRRHLNTRANELRRHAHDRSISSSDESAQDCGQRLGLIDGRSVAAANSAGPDSRRIAR